MFALGSTWFELINHWLPDPAVAAQTGFHYDAGLRRIAFEMAAMIVAFPAFVVATRAILHDLDANPDKVESGIRRWLTNLALLLTALVFIGDLVAFLSAFLQGELTARFVLKSLTVCLLAICVFLYYLRGLGKAFSITRAWHRSFAIGAAVGIVATLALGFSVFGSPANQRLQAEDRRRLNDLQKIAGRIHYWWSIQPLESRALPEKWPVDVAEARRDPFTGREYTYERVSKTQYRLCALFNLRSPLAVGVDDPWHHSSGRQCFSFNPDSSPPLVPYAGP